MLFISLPNMITIEEEKAVQDRIDQAKIAIMMEQETAFYSALLAGLKLNVGRLFPTAATNGIDLWINPDFIHELDTPLLMFVMMHEIMHVALDHCNWEIQKGLNRYVLGIAQDHFINLYLQEMGYTVWEHAYCDPKYTGWSSMQIYHDIMQDPPEEPPNWQPDALGKPDDMTPEEFKTRIEDNMIKAAMQAEMAGQPGSVPGHIAVKIKEMVAPELPWNLILYKYMDKYCKDDFSWSRPNRRFLPQFYLPNMAGEKLGGVFSGIDVSGSMMNEIDEVMAENRYIKELTAPQWFHLVTFDTELHHDKIYEEYDHLPEGELPDGGAGGTYVEPLIEMIKEERPVFALIFTDGYFGDPDMTGVESDVYWVITKDGDPNFEAPGGVGTVIHMN